MYGKSITTGLIISIQILILLTGCSHTTQSIQPSPEPLIPPAPPQRLTLEKATQTNISLVWMDTSNDEDGFRIYRDGNLVGTVPSNTTSYLDTGLTTATSYRYVVRSFNETGESSDATILAKTLNPPITITIDKVGVFDNGESAMRDIDGGEVYVYIVVTDGETTVEQRIPTEEGTYLYLEDDEMVNTVTTVFSTDEVNDSLTIGIVGYESDGSGFESLVYQAVGATVGSQIGGGGLLDIFNLNLGGLIGQFFGEEDDFLGSYENTWSITDNWGIGNYSDITCLEEDGTPGLRIWFTIKNPGESIPVLEPDLPGKPLIEHNITLSILDEESYQSKYGNNHPSYYPYSEFGIHYSKLFNLKKAYTVIITLRSLNGICHQKTFDECEEGLVMMVYRRMDPFTIRTYAAEIISCEVDSIDGMKEATLMFRAIEDGDYQLSLFNETGMSASCNYSIYLIE